MNQSIRLNGKHPAVDFSELDEVAGVTSIAVYITPEIAARLLLRNTRNRKLSEKVVVKYVAEIQAGEWRLTPAGIGFDDTGVLVDGQHRLSAIVRAKQAVPLVVTLGLPSTSQEKVDRQRRRTLFDALYLAGHAACRQEVEIATCLTRRVVRSESGAVPSDSLVKQTLDCHRENIRAVLDLMHHSNKNVRGLCQASFLAAAVLYHEIDAGKCADFLKAIRTGEMLTQDHPAMRLRRFLMGETAMVSMPRGGANQSYVFRRSIYAMQAHLMGRNITALREAENFELSALPRRDAAFFERATSDGSSV
jgi:hypothetical protein